MGPEYASVLLSASGTSVVVVHAERMRSARTARCNCMKFVETHSKVDAVK
jgi:hypothetical protein